MLLFSDLHSSPRTYVTCMEVLRRVHCEAVQRHISVGFLSDFFDKVQLFMVVHNLYSDKTSRFMP